jgi:hypothetical protein
VKAAETEPKGLEGKKVDYFCFITNKNNYATNQPFQCKDKCKNS